MKLVLPRWPSRSWRRQDAFTIVSSPAWVLRFCARHKRPPPISCNAHWLGRWRLIRYDVSIFDRFPYKMLYIVRGDLITVAVIAHQHRNPDYWVDRISTL